MPNGKVGDHPLTDIVVHKRRTFSAEIDSLIRKIVELGGRKHLETRFNFFALPAKSEFKKALEEVKLKLEEDAKTRDAKAQL